MEFEDYWRTIRRRWRVVAISVLLAVGAAGLLTWQTTPQYASSARIFVATAASDTSESYQGGLFAAQRVASYADLVANRKLAEHVAQDLGGGQYVADRVQDAVSARVVPQTVNLVITATDADPVMARDIAQTYAEALSDLVAEIETPDGQDGALIKASVVDDALISDQPVSPQPVRNVGFAFTVGLILGVVLALLREILDTTVTSVEDIAEVTEAPILGHINNDPRSARRVHEDVLNEHSAWSESFRVLRTNMQYVDVDRDRRTFVVSSPLPAEGKSTTSINLAVALAMAGQSVALVECDLRRPRMAAQLGLDGQTGTTSVLIGRVPLDEALQEYRATGLKVLTCGPLPPNPSEMLQSHAMEKLMNDLRDRFDVVLLDSPPLLPVTDAALLAAQADGLLLVTRHGRTTKDQLRQALRRLQAVDATCVGVVINLAQPRKARAYDYSYASDQSVEAAQAGQKTAASKRQLRAARRATH